MGRRASLDRPPVSASSGFEFPSTGPLDTLEILGVR